jgi:hypothetical protein
MGTPRPMVRVQPSKTEPRSTKMRFFYISREVANGEVTTYLHIGSFYFFYSRPHLRSLVK